MKILLLTTLYPEDNRPDLKKDTRAIHYFAKQWVDDGHEVYVLHMYLHPVKEIYKYNPKVYARKVYESELDGVNVLLMENQLMWPKAGRLSKRQKNIAVRNINKYLYENLPDFKPEVMLVHFPCYLTGIVEGIDIRCPRVAILHQTDLRIMSQKMNNSSVEKIFNTYQGIGFRAPYIKKEFKNYINDNRPKFVAYSGIPEEIIPSYNSLLNYKQSNKTKKLNIVYAGRLIPLKNVDIILKALSRLPKEVNFHFTIIGTGIEMKKLIKLVKSLGLQKKVSFKGNLLREKVIKQMRKADVFIMASKPETFGLVYLEAMTQGCITIGSKGEGIDGVIVDGENGFLIEPKNIESLTNRINDIFYLDESIKDHIIKNAYETAKEMIDKNMAQRYLNSVKEII